MSLHRRLVHREFVEGCFGCKVSTVQMNAGDASSRGDARSVKARDKRWEKDMPAYKRLRQEGFQPPSIDGAAALERDASTKFEIESGRAYRGQEKQVKDAVAFFEEGTGRSVFEPAAKPKETT